jgi:hypothetical protein
MMNPNALMDLARDRSRELLEDASPSRRRARIEDEPSASDGHVILGRAALAINTRAHSERRAIARSATAFELSVDAR